MEHIEAIVIEKSCIFLFLVSSVDVSKHDVSSIVTNEKRLILFKEEDEALLFIVDDLFPEVIAFLVAFTRGRTVDSTSVILLAYFEANYHQEGMA